MVRRSDSGWRDEMIPSRHRQYGFRTPVAGMMLPMVEYDRGRAVGLVSYMRARHALPLGPDVASAYRAFGMLHSSSDGGMLPFLTAAYDPRDWSFKVFPHNEAAKLLTGHTTWHTIPEREFVALLYRMRDKALPDLSAYGVVWNEHLSSFEQVASVDVPEERWPGEHLSVRRREYEPSVAIPFGLRIPCMDADFAVINQDDQVALFVDYKRAGSAREPGHSNMRALASMAGGSQVETAAIMAMYAPGNPAWKYSVYPLNRAAKIHLSFAIGHSGHGTKLLADAIAGDGWLDLDESQWLDVLRCARDL
jgi:hypothetical protein